MYLDGTQIGTTYTDNNDYGETKPICLVQILL